MNDKRSSELINSSIILSIGTFLPRLASFVILPILTGYLTKEEYGSYDLIVVLASLILPAAVSRNLAGSMGRFTLYSVLAALVCGIGGCIGAYYAGCAASALIVLCLGGAFGVSFLFRRAAADRSARNRVNVTIAKPLKRCRFSCRETLEKV